MRAAQTVRTAFIINLTINNATAQISSGSQNNAFSFKNLAGFGFHAHYLTIFYQQLINHQLLELQIFLLFHNLFHQGVIIGLILLTTQGMHGIPLARVQKTHLNAGQVSTNTHLTTQGIQLAH